jgi:hypothetical protein
MHPAFITFTGLDAATDLDEVGIVSNAHAVEWGILLHPVRQGEGRYPPLATVEAALARDLSCAAHLCGGYARAVVNGEPLPAEIVALLGKFKRIQVNTSARNIDLARVAAFASRFKARGILQCRGLAGC